LQRTAYRSQLALTLVRNAIDSAIPSARFAEQSLEVRESSGFIAVGTGLEVRESSGVIAVGTG